MQTAEIIRDDSLRELIPHKTGLAPFRYYEDDMTLFPGHTADLHWHAEFEITIVKKGLVLFQIDGRQIPVKEGEGIFINSRILHGLQAPGEGLIPTILFTSDLLAAQGTFLYDTYLSCFLNSDISWIKFSPDIPWQKQALEALNGIYRTAGESSSPDEMELHIRVCRLWQLLYSHRKEMNRTAPSRQSLRSHARLEQMLRYMEAHYREKLTLADIAASASISKSEAMRCFREGLQVSPMACLNEYRLSRARDLLLETNDPVTEIALSAGFESCSYFDRLFLRKYGVTPRALRRDRPDRSI